MMADPMMTVSQEDRWSLSEHHAGRSLILCTLGAVAGLAMAGFGLFTAQGTRTSAVPAEDVARVNQVPILMSDYIAHLRAQYDVPLSRATQAQKQQALADMLREELYVQRGVELGMQADTTEVRSALVGAVEAQAASDAAMSQPDDGQLAAYYREHADTYATEGRMALAEYMLPPGAGQAADAVADLRREGASPAVLQRHTLRRTARMTQGLEFYFAAQEHLGARLFAIARTLPPGAVSDPVTLPDGIHILVMQANLSPRPSRLEDVRNKVLNDYIADQAKLLTERNERFLQRRADIQIQKGFE
jgi:hypothetical protein